jgi:hypothetical protein
MIDEQRDVLAARAQRGRRDRDDVEAVEQVLAEAARCTSARRSLLVAATMRTSARTVSPPTGSYSPSCSTRRSFTCTERRELADLVEEERAPRGAREAALAPRERAREGAALVAEELGLEDVSGMAEQLTATKGPRARLDRSWMKRASSSLPVPLSPSTSTVALDGAACVATSSTRRSAGLEPTISRLVSSLISSLERAVLGDERLPLRRLAHALDDRHALERLLDEVVRALAHRLHRGLHRAVGGHHHHLGVGRELLQRAQQLEAARCPASSGR